MCYVTYALRGAWSKGLWAKLRPEGWPKHTWSKVIEGRFEISFYEPHHTNRMRHKVNFKRSLTGLNSEFSFSQTSCHTKAKEHSLPYYFTHSWMDSSEIYTFLKGISAVRNVQISSMEIERSRMTNLTGHQKLLYGNALTWHTHMNALKWHDHVMTGKVLGDDITAKSKLWQNQALVTKT